MKIAFFEIEEWEEAYLEKKLVGHELSFDLEPLTEEKLTKLGTYDILSPFIYSPIKKEDLEKLPQLKLIATRSTGYDHIDVQACKERNITVCNVPEYGSHTVAEHTFSLILALSRKLIPSLERAKRGDFNLEGLRGFDLYGKTLGIIGYGHIGKVVSRIAQGFGMKVVAFTKHAVEDSAVSFLDLPTLLQTADIVSLHIPYTKETHHIINKENIHLFKKGSTLINTARGGLVETEAIVKGLDEGNLSAVGLDVLEEECYIKEERQLLTEQFLKECDLKTQLLNHVLLTKENVLITPHNAFNSVEALQRILDVTGENILDFINQKPQNVVS